MTFRRLAVACAVVSLLASLFLLAQPPASAHNYFAFLFNYAGFAQNPEKLSPMPPASDAEVDRLLQQLKSRDRGTRWIASGALGQTGNPRAVEPLLGALNDKDPSVCASAALSLGMLKDKRAVEPLEGILASEDESQAFAQMTAFMALDLLGVQAELPGGEDDSTGYLDEYIEESLPKPFGEAYRAGDKARAMKILLGLFDTAKNDDERQGLYEVLWRTVDDSCLDVLLAAVKTGKLESKRAAASVLDRTKDPRSLDALIALASDNSPKCRAAAISSLGEFDDPRARSTVIAALQDKSPGVSRAALRSLEEKKGPEIVDALIPLLNDKDPEKVSSAARLLGEIRDPRATDPLLAALSCAAKGAPDVVSEICSALGVIGDPKTVQPIVAAYAGDPDSAMDALRGIKHASAAKALFGILRTSKDPEGIRGQFAADIMLRIGDASIDPALEALGDANFSVRQAAVRVFTGVKDPRSVAPLMTALGEKNAGVRSQSAKALANQGDKQAAPKLRAILKDLSADVRAQAALALGALQDADSGESLAAMLTDRNPIVRMSAGLALCELGDERGIPRILEPPTADEIEEPLPFDNMRVLKACVKLKDKRTIGLVLDIMSYNLASINQSTFDGEPDREMIQAPVDALTAITGQDLGHAYYRWMAWGIAEANWKPTLGISPDSEEQ